MVCLRRMGARMAENTGTGIGRVVQAARWSLAGWRAAWATQRSLRQWTALFAVSLVLALVLDLDGGERALLIALGLLVLAAELFNSAIEATVDYISTARDPRAALAKDCGSAAVAVTALAAGAAWVAVLVG
jgi:diacylglycerol kinase (ATP)